MKSWITLLVLSVTLLKLKSSTVSYCKFFEEFNEENRLLRCNATFAHTLALQISNSGGCFKYKLKPNSLLFHTWISGGLKWRNENFRLMATFLLEAFVVTQDLKYSTLIFWVPPGDAAVINETNIDIFNRFYPYVRLQIFDYDYEVSRTPLAISDVLSNFANLSSIKFKGSDDSNIRLNLYSDIIRSTLLYNYGK